MTTMTETKERILKRLQNLHDHTDNSESGRPIELIGFDKGYKLAMQHAKEIVESEIE